MEEERLLSEQMSVLTERLFTSLVSTAVAFTSLLLLGRLTDRFTDVLFSL